MCTRIHVNSFCYEEKYQVTESSFPKRISSYANRCVPQHKRDRKNPSRSNSWGVPVLDLGFNQSRRYRGDFVFSRYTCVFHGAVQLEKPSAELDSGYEKTQHSFNRNDSTGFSWLNFDLK